MKLDIKKIKLGELESFVRSKAFMNFETVPITTLRVDSYINNPAALQNDIVLYLGFTNDKLVAFRTIFAGQVNSESEPVRFGWCSGNWVHPEYRRKGFSEKLLNEVFHDWDNRLMFTNYAPNSEQLYLKTGRFQVIHQFQGFRGYMFPKTRKLLPNAIKNAFSRAFYNFLDIVISIISLARTMFYIYKINPDIKFESIKYPDETCLKFMEQNQSALYFLRRKTELNWIFQYPWMTNNEEDLDAKYPFSSFSEDFRYQTVKIYNKNKFAGFFMFSVRNNHLKTLHFEIPAELNNEITAFIKNYCISQKIEIATVYNFNIGSALLKRKFPFLYAKKYGQKIYSSFLVNQNLPHSFQDGDGDVFLT